jgi:hypothetical protein
VAKKRLLSKSNKHVIYLCVCVLLGPRACHVGKLTLPTATQKYVVGIMYSVLELQVLVDLHTFYTFKVDNKIFPSLDILVLTRYDINPWAAKSFSACYIW